MDLGEVATTTTLLNHHIIRFFKMSKLKLEMWLEIAMRVADMCMGKRIYY